MILCKCDACGRTQEAERTTYPQRYLPWGWATLQVNGQANIGYVGHNTQQTFSGKKLLVCDACAENFNIVGVRTAADKPPFRFVVDQPEVEESPGDQLFDIVRELVAEAIQEQ